MINNFDFAEATIETGNISNGVSIGLKSICGFIFPPEFEGATVTLEAARQISGTYLPVKDPSTGNLITIYAGADAYVPILPADLFGIPYLKIISATNVAAPRKIYIVTKDA